MKMFCEILETAKELDSVIEKGLSLPDCDLRKGLSFDPFVPYEMHEQSNYYNPYRWVDNGYMPYPVEYWRDQGKSPERESYAEVQKLYDQVNFRRSAFKSMIKTIETDLVKAGAVPVGTVHTYQNGVQYKKIAEGQWAPVKDPSKPMTGHQDIERHAQGVSTIKDQIKQKTREGNLTEQIKEEARREATKQVREAMKQIFGDEMPKGLSSYFAKIDKKNEMTDIENQKDVPTRLKAIEAESKGKSHTVSVDFTHNGKTYSHVFNNVLGTSQQEINGRIADLVKKRIPGAVISKINTTAKEKKPSPKAKWQDKVKEQPEMR